MMLFTLCVLLPLTGVLNSWVRSLRDIIINQEGIHFHTLIKTIQFKWNEIESINLSHEFHTHSDAHLYLVIKPKNPDIHIVSLDLSKGSSSIRARIFFVNEITKLFGSLNYSSKDQLDHLNLNKIEF